MRILVAGKYAPTGPNPIGGVQSWIGTVADELRRLGHDVVVWQPGFPAVSGRFGLGILSNWTHTAALAESCDRVRVVSHGIIAEERPPAGVPLAFTSEGVRDHWKGDGPIIRQPIDLEFWKPNGKRGNALVRYSYRSGLPWLAGVASSLGMPFQHLRSVTHAQARAVLAAAGCVLATGRAALEAMACGVPVVLVDHRSAYQGPLLHTGGATEWMRTNYSGRGGVAPTAESVQSAIAAAVPMRSHIERHHDARTIVAQLLESRS